MNDEIPWNGAAVAGRDKYGGNDTAEVIYHYTDVNGLIGIVKSRTVWATESNFLNDPSEVAYGAEQLLAAIERRAGVGPATRVERVKSLLRAAYSDPHSEVQYREDRSFVTSFSRSDEHLTLWRMYAGQHGFCIGFDTVRLLEYLGQPPPPQSEPPRGRDEAERGQALDQNFHLDGRIVDVTYGPSGTDAIFDQLFGRAGHTSGNEDWVRQPLRALAHVKHPAYSDEREVRLIVNEQGDFAPDRSVRSSASHGLVSYHSVAIPREAIRSVTAAPGANFPKTRSALSSLFADGARGAWSHVKLRESTIPLAW